MSLKIKGLNKKYGNTAVLSDFSYDFPTGVTAILSPTGSGKTTLLRLIAGLEAPDSGQIERHGNISMLFQEDRLLPTLTAIENIEIVLKDAGEAPAEILSKLGLGGWENSLPHELSGGMKRRVSLARALVYGSDILLMDEPFKGLDTASRDEVMDITASYINGRTVIMVTHNIDEALYLADEIIVANGAPFNVREKVEIGADIESRKSDKVLMKSLQKRLTQITRA